MRDKSVNQRTLPPPPLAPPAPCPLRPSIIHQVIAVFRSFPFRTAATAAATAAAATDEADAPAEETQQPPPPAYETVHNTNGNDVDANDHHHINNANNAANSIINNNNISSSSSSNSNNNNNGWNNGREPEEAGEIAAAEGDPENVGEYANAPIVGAVAATAAVVSVFLCVFRTCTMQ